MSVGKETEKNKSLVTRGKKTGGDHSELAFRSQLWKPLYTASSLLNVFCDF